MATCLNKYQQYIKCNRQPETNKEIVCCDTISISPRGTRKIEMFLNFDLKTSKYSIKLQECILSEDEDFLQHTPQIIYFA